MKKPVIIGAKDNGDIMKKPVIIGAKENKCEFCNGIIYKLKTSLGIIRQCKKCGNTY